MKGVACLSLVVVCWTAMAWLVTAIPDYTGLPPGPYCKIRGCCNGRQDQCSSPIIGTLCYCDDFCNRTRSEDCCPDFWSHCKGIEQIVDRRCLHEGKYYDFQKTVQKNCNLCKCDIGPDGSRSEMLCEENECIIEPLLLEAVNNLGQSVLGWRAENYTDFWGRTLEDGLKLRLGTLQPDRSVLTIEPVKKYYDPLRLPRSFDAEERWPDQMSGIEDQGWCGSSWAISTAAVASDRYAIMSMGDEEVKLSAQQLLSCNNRGQQSCNGGHLDRAWLYIRKYGVVDADCYPYVGKAECKFRGKPRKLHWKQTGCAMPDNPQRKEMYKVSPAYRLGNETDIMYEIFENGPVQATMRVPQDFFSYKEGIYKDTLLSSPHRKAYHSVRIVGWGEDRSFNPPRKYWKVANSWGEQWGENGYFRIERGTNECDIEMFVLGAWAKPIDASENEILQTRSFVVRRRGHRRRQRLY